MVDNSLFIRKLTKTAKQSFRMFALRRGLNLADAFAEVIMLASIDGDGRAIEKANPDSEVANDPENR